MQTATSIRQTFEDQGFFLAKGLLRHRVTELEAEFDRIVGQLMASGEDLNARWGGAEADRIGGANTVVLHTHNVQQYSAAWTRALLDEAFLDVAEAIVGPDIVLHHTKLFQKPAELGAPFPMHQDWEYFPFENDTMMAGIIHVSDATDAMGCLRVYPGSHKLGRLSSAQGWSEKLVTDYPIERAKPLEAEPGDVLFFHYLTIHGSMPNRSDRVRKTVLAQLHSGSDRMEPSSHPYEGLVLRGWNHAMTRENANRAK